MDDRCVTPQVHIFQDLPPPWQTWRFIPVEHMYTPPQPPPEMLGSSSLPDTQAPVPAPSYDSEQDCVHCHESETSDDELGKTVTEVTVTTTTNTVTARRKYRVEGE